MAQSPSLNTSRTNISYAENARSISLKNERISAEINAELIRLKKETIELHKDLADALQQTIDSIKSRKMNPVAEAAALKKEHAAHDAMLTESNKRLEEKGAKAEEYQAKMLKDKTRALAYSIPWNQFKSSLLKQILKTEDKKSTQYWNATKKHWENSSDLKSGVSRMFGPITGQVSNIFSDLTPILSGAKDTITGTIETFQGARKLWKSFKGDSILDKQSKVAEAMSDFAKNIGVASNKVDDLQLAFQRSKIAAEGLDDPKEAEIAVARAIQTFNRELEDLSKKKIQELSAPGAVNGISPEEAVALERSLGKFTSRLDNIQSLGKGGVVGKGGITGAPQLIVAHKGEIVVPPENIKDGKILGQKKQTSKSIWGTRKPRYSIPVHITRGSGRGSQISNILERKTIVPKKGIISKSKGILPSVLKTPNMPSIQGAGGLLTSAAKWVAGPIVAGIAGYAVGSVINKGIATVTGDEGWGGTLFEKIGGLFGMKTIEEENNEKIRETERRIAENRAKKSDRIFSKSTDDIKESSIKIEEGGESIEEAARRRGLSPSPTETPKKDDISNGNKAATANDVYTNKEMARQGERNAAPFKKIFGGKEDFKTSQYESLLEEAKKAGVKNPEVIAELGTRQSALETGYGKHAPGNNYFGIKNKNGNSLSTQEFENGKMVTKNQNFGSYGSREESNAAYIKFLQKNKRYKKVLAAGDIYTAMSAIGIARYASDQNYVQKISKIELAKGKVNSGAPVARELTTEIAKEDTSYRQQVLDKVNARRNSTSDSKPVAGPTVIADNSSTTVPNRTPDSMYNGIFLIQVAT